MDAADEQGFRDFVAARSTALLRTAYLLVGDLGRAEDLLQTAMVKTYLAWPRIRDRTALEGYVRRTMATTATSWWRRHRSRERPTERLPDRPGDDEIAGALARDAMWQHLLSLPAKQRTVLVLRFYEGMAEAEIASAMGVSRGTVKSHGARALASLRRRLENEEREMGVRR
jgi:RNA polymerase sigma-70 factor, ECF subfamily